MARSFKYSDLPGFYFELYVLIYAQNGQVVGSGICIDGKHILTSAKVVELQGRFIQLSFPESTLFPGHYFRAKIRNWISSDSKNKTVGSDVALLELVDENLSVKLSPFIDALHFVQAKSGLVYDCISYLPTASAYHVTGKIGSYFAAEGKTQLNVNDSNSVTFFSAGAAGSPVFCAEKMGIAGIVSEWNSHQGGQLAFMVDVRHIETLDWGILLLPEIPVPVKMKRQSQSDKWKSELGWIWSKPFILLMLLALVLGFVFSSHQPQSAAISSHLIMVDSVTKAPLDNVIVAVYDTQHHLLTQSMPSDKSGQVKLVVRVSDGMILNLTIHREDYSDHFFTIRSSDLMRVTRFALHKY